MKYAFWLGCFGGLLASFSVSAATYFVSLESSNPTAPYTNWVTAATNIQDAVDAASAGDTVLVSNGVYTAGGRETFDRNGISFGSNRVVVTNAISLLSVAGPEFTVIDGGGSNRCVLLSDGASLTGFMLTNGGTGSRKWYHMQDGGGGGAWCATANVFITNCIITENRSVDCHGGGVYRGTLYDCTLRGNFADWTTPEFSFAGGGVFESTLYNCKLERNSADDGGGACESILYNCALGRNWAYCGGGASGGRLYNCILTNNGAMNGGGACFGVLFNCRISDNSAENGGGVSGGTLYNCTLTGNSAEPGGGAEGAKLYNCIAYFNECYGTYFPGEEIYADCVVNQSCTVPLPKNGSGNITNAPLFIDYEKGDLHLQPNSPCINAGNNGYVTMAADLDGNPRIIGGTVDIGAYEFQSPQSVISYAWLQQYGLPTDGSADFLDLDSDGHNSWSEWISGTCPTNRLSALRMLSASRMGAQVTVAWQSVEGIKYFLECSTNLTTLPPFKCVATNLLGQPETTTYGDSNAPAVGQVFYRVGVPGK